jgi:hypothetical protein
MAWFAWPCPTGLIQCEVLAPGQRPDHEAQPLLRERWILRDIDCTRRQCPSGTSCLPNPVEQERLPQADLATHRKDPRGVRRARPLAGARCHNRTKLGARRRNYTPAAARDAPALFRTKSRRPSFWSSTHPGADGCLTDMQPSCTLDEAPRRDDPKNVPANSMFMTI